MMENNEYIEIFIKNKYNALPIRTVENKPRNPISRKIK